MRFIKRSLILICLLTISVGAQITEQTPLITVTGTAEVQVAPDEAVFSLNVSKIDKVLLAAKNQNDHSVGQVLALTKRFAIAERDVKTDFISVTNEYEYVGSGDARRRIFAGFNVSKTVIIKLRDLKRFEEFFGDLLRTGVSEVTRVSFETSELRTHKDEARAQAVRAAREKAAAMAGELRQQIGRAVRIRERNVDSGYATNFSSNTAVLGGSSGDSSETFAAGTITIKAQVEIDFLLN